MSVLKAIISGVGLLHKNKFGTALWCISFLPVAFPPWNDAARKSSPDTEYTGTLILDFPTSRPVRNVCIVYKLTSFSYSITAAQNRLRQIPYQLHGLKTFSPIS